MQIAVHHCRSYSAVKKNHFQQLCARIREKRIVRVKSILLVSLREKNVGNKEQDNLIRYLKLDTPLSFQIDGNCQRK